MTTAYLLPCTCGEKLRIDSSQAGLDVRCRCGLNVKAPTFRELSQLERVEEVSTKRPRPEWGSRERLLLSGAVVGSLGLVMAGWFYFQIPQTPQIAFDTTDARRAVEQMTAEQLVTAWEEISTQDFDPTELPILGLYRSMAARSRGYMYVGLVIASGGAILLLASLFVGKTGQTQSKLPARASS